ncbi:MAG: radical SAM protein [Gemmatales bacterium]
MPHRPLLLLLQLPIPPLGPGKLRGNVPLAAGYLKMYASLQGLDQHFNIEILPSHLANTLSEQGLVEAILTHQPRYVGFTCYLWNIDRTLWIAQRLKECDPSIQIILGGPEITIDNGWVLQQAAIDYFIIGEGEQTFAELLQCLASGGISRAIPGLHVPRVRKTLSLERVDIAQPLLPGFEPRHPLENLDQISSPYLSGILDAADESMLLLETIRGCIFKCKFCYYPKSYQGLHFLSREKIIANLRHARERGAHEVVLLDPTLNQRKDFDDFLRLLIEENPGRRMSYFGELRAEGIKPATAELLAQANFTEVEVGLQSIDPLAMQLMDRKNNLNAVEKGCRAMLAAGIKVKVDLIIGLPGDTVESVRRSMHYLKDSGIYSDVQVFNLAVLPGTAFRQEAQELGLVFQPRPPYYVRQTPTLNQQQLFDLMAEAADIFEIDWDPLPDVDFQTIAALVQKPADGVLIHLDVEGNSLPPARLRHQVYTLWFQSSDFTLHARRACRVIRELLRESPYTTLQIILEPESNPCTITSEVLDELWQACQEQPSYMDRYYSMQPGRPIGAKRILILVDEGEPLDEEWLDMVDEQATLIKREREVVSV